MQRGIVKFAKDIIETLKKEIKGPKIIEGEINDRSINVQGSNFHKEIEIKSTRNFSEIAITSMNETEENIAVRNAIMTGEEKRVELLNDSFAIGDKSFNIEKGFTEIKEIEIEKINTNISKIKADEIEADIKWYDCDTKIFTFEGLKKIFEMPIKIKSDDMNEISIQELEIIKKKISQVFIKNILNYNIRNIFRKIPVENVKNLKYYPERNMLEIMVSGSKKNSKKADFVVLESKLDGKFEKIII